MKIMIISDIHGIKTNLDKIKDKYIDLTCDKLVILGDLYYIGPRNNIVDDYDIEYVKNWINSFKENILCVKGNCDSNVDIKVTEIPIIDELGMIMTENNDIYFTHGHIYNKDNWKYANSILVSGHTHIAEIEKIESNIYANPGSISLPRSNELASYLIYDEENIIIYDINDKIIKKMAL